MLVEDFDYYLPKELIAQQPLEQRDNSRLMVLTKHGSIKHKKFSDLIEFLNPGDVLVLNNTRVMNARLYGTREDTGGRIEILLLSCVSRSDNIWHALVKPGKRGKIGTTLVFNSCLRGKVIDIIRLGIRVIKFSPAGDMADIVERIGNVPLPPYIKGPINDPGQYQTIYSEALGSAAAPTAGLHFTHKLLDDISQKGVNLSMLTLHVGLGTFRPVKVEIVEEHKMHGEYYEATKDQVNIINSTVACGGKVVAVGTTTVRTLESLPMDETGKLLPSSGLTCKFIYPGYKFKVVDSIVTNFHLPRSTLLMLVSAFGGHEKVMSAYKIAVKERYRFFSFGDAMLLL